MPEITLEYPQLADITLDNLPRLRALRDAHFDLHSEICIELPHLMTEYMKDHHDPNDPPELMAAKRLKYVLENKQPVTEDGNLLAGTTTTRPVGVILYPDFLSALSIWPELETIHKRKENPYGITKAQIKELNFNIFPYWINRTVAEVARRKYHNPICQQVMERIAFYICSKPVCISHTTPDYSAVVSRGLAAIREEAQGKEKAQGDSEADRNRAVFYQAVQIVIDGVLAYAQNLSRQAAQLARQESDSEHRRELETMSDICARVPAEMPQTFREALNAVWICKIALHQENANVGFSIGRLDQVFYDLYRNDIDSGRLTPQEAVELVGCLWLKIADHVPVIPETGEKLFGGTGSNQAITLGGVDMQGNDAVNDLTYVMLRATELLRLRDPNVNCRYYPGVNSEEYLHHLCRVNVSTGATPCFHNDISTIEALRSAQRMTLEHARDYASAGCVEPVSTGRTYGHPAAIFINLTSLLEMALYQGKHRLTEDEQIGPVTPAPETMTSFEEFKQAFETQLGWIVDQSVTLNNYFGKVHQMIHPTPLLSALTEGCIQKGKDLIEGGAVYNSSGATIIGLAEVTDSLSAIEEFVFRKKVVTLPQMIEAINENWEGSHQKLHQMIKTSKEKFGTDSRMAKANADYLLDLLYRLFNDKQNYRGGHYTVGYWTMTYHAGFALLTGALPSGRVRGEPLPSGITPVSGAAPQLTPCLNFMAGLDHTKIGNSHALNLKYTPSQNRELTVTKFAQSVEAYMRTGGMQVQFNIIERATLEDAAKHPENYRDLLVRVSGYSAYFIDITPIMQQEIITRAEYDLLTGREVIYPR
ncbi:pyruvate formate lyase family protein [Chloroflexota bacterium]